MQNRKLINKTELSQLPECLKISKYNLLFYGSNKQSFTKRKHLSIVFINLVGEIAFA